MSETSLSSSAFSARRPGRELALLTVGQAALAATVYGLGLPQHVNTLGIIPLPFLATRWPRWTLALDLMVLLGLGSSLSVLMADDPGSEVRRVAIQVLALGALSELVRRVVVSRTEALAALAVTEARRRLLVESLKVIPWELDLATRSFVYVGPQAERLLGHPVSAWRDMASWEAMIHPDDRAAAVSFCNEATERGVDHELEYRMLALDGSIVWIRDIVTVVNRDGRPELLRGVMIDETEKRAATESRGRLERRLLEGQRLESLGLLAGGVAHDFNNLLTPILGNVSAVLERESLSAGAQEQLRDAEKAALRAAEIAGQMLAYSGRARFEVRPDDLSRIVGATVRLFGAGASKQTALKLDLSGEPVWVRVEAAQLGQVVMNLLSNAADAVGESGGSVAVRTGISEPDAVLSGERLIDEPMPSGSCALLEVRDDGAGMDEETRQRVFDPFFTTKPDGHGLGMASVLGIVRAHGGAIDIESAPGSGTCVRVLLPLSQAPVASGEAAEKGTDRALPPVQPGCILVVDDEPWVRSILRRALEHRGHTVIEAGDGEEALATFGRMAADITAVILDMTMPRLSGAETLSRLRDLAPDLPVLLISGYAEEDFTATDERGRTAFLAKPFRAADVHARLAQLMGIAQASS